MGLLNEAAVGFQIVLTKADDAKPYWLAQRQLQAAELVRKYTAAHPLVITTSSEKGTGMADLRAELATLAEE
jgi:GTP-binding protein